SSVCPSCWGCSSEALTSSSTESSRPSSRTQREGFRMARQTLRDRLAARRAEEAAAEAPEEQQGQWYVLHTYSGYENKVKKPIEGRVEAYVLEDRVFEVVVPTQDEIEIRNGQRHAVQQKVFPEYVLVRMDIDEETWYQLRTTPGVTG